MMVIKFRDAEEGNHLLKKMKKMQKSLDEVIDCVEQKIEESYDEYESPQYRESDYRRSRYNYRGM